MLIGSRQPDAGHILENIVYLELLRRGYDVYVGKVDEFEVDFVAQNSKGTKYFQVALSVRDEKTLARELRPLQAIKDHYPKVILTMDDDPEGHTQDQREGLAAWIDGLTKSRFCKASSALLDFLPEKVYNGPIYYPVLNKIL